MSDFQIDDIGKLTQFATLIDELVAMFEPDSKGGNAIVPDVLLPEPASLFPNMGQQPGPGSPGRFSGFRDAVNLYSSYDTYRRYLVGDPGELTAANPGSSALGTFVDGLRHLSATAKSIYQNYNNASHTEQLSVQQIQAALDASSSVTG